MDFSALITFLSELALNNSKPWFEEHRPAYKQLRGEWLAFVGQVIDGISQFDPSVGIVSPKDALFRMNRDVRFAKDKRPYKTTFGAESARRVVTAGCRPTTSRSTKRAPCLLAAASIYRSPRSWARSGGISPSTRSGYPQSLPIQPPRPPSGRSTESGSSGRPRVTTKRRRASSSSSSRASPPASSRRAGFCAGMILRPDRHSIRALFPLIGWLRGADRQRDLGYLSPQGSTGWRAWIAALRRSGYDARAGALRTGLSIHHKTPLGRGTVPVCRLLLCDLSVRATLLYAIDESIAPENPNRLLGDGQADPLGPAGIRICLLGAACVAVPLSGAIRHARRPGNGSSIWLSSGCS